MINQSKIIKKYHELCAKPSDINELLPYLHSYSERCNHITEMGVRNPTSTYAFLAANPKKLISYDIHRSPGLGEVEDLAPEVFTFNLQDVLEAEIEETDFLFLDTYHTAAQLSKELERHSGKVRKYIGFHDTDSFWEIGESPYDDINPEVACGNGLKYAIKPFLAMGGWYISFMTDKNNGLLIIERKKRGLIFQKQVFSHLRYSLYLNSKKMRHLIFKVKQKILG
jgi:hypothetical protein